ncbi:MAG: hypothetical protein ACI9BW_004253 [Gammaproteobacteria bacterium]|jgi:hypothetical protein
MLETQKIQWLYDVECIKQLKHRYCAYCDEQYDPDGIASLFTPDGVWEGGSFGRAEGREGIRSFFAEVSKQVSFANHYVSNPIIEIAGDTATGRWDLWQPMVMAPEPAALWLIAKYREQYVRTGDSWMFKLLELDVKALSPYEQGFAKQRFIEAD